MRTVLNDCAAAVLSCRCGSNARVERQVSARFILCALGPNLIESDRRPLDRSRPPASIPPSVYGMGQRDSAGSG